MKRCIILILCLCLLLCGCGNSSPVSTGPTLSATDPMGNRIEYSDRGKSVSVKNLPCHIEYNGSTFELTGVEMYESYSEETYSYFLYAIVAFDVSDLTDAEIHWLTKEDIDVYMLFDQAKSDDDVDFAYMSVLGSLHLTDTGELFYVFTPSYWNAYRDSFAGSGCFLSIKVTQQDTYQYKDTDLQKKFSYSYYFDIPDDMKDSEAIEQPLYDYMVKWLEQ